MYIYDNTVILHQIISINIFSTNVKYPLVSTKQKPYNSTFCVSIPWRTQKGKKRDLFKLTPGCRSSNPSYLHIFITQKFRLFGRNIFCCLTTGPSSKIREFNSTDTIFILLVYGNRGRNLAEEAKTFNLKLNLRRELMKIEKFSFMYYSWLWVLRYPIFRAEFIL